MSGGSVYYGVYVSDAGALVMSGVLAGAGDVAVEVGISVIDAVAGSYGNLPDSAPDLRALLLLPRI